MSPSDAVSELMGMNDEKLRDMVRMLVSMMLPTKLLVIGAIVAFGGAV